MGKTILIFGGGFLQLSLIHNCASRGIRTVVIDPFPGAPGKDHADIFEVVGGQDFDTTCAIVEKYEINGLATSASDKPLVMMSRIAARYKLPFYSEETAKMCTDKYLMKERFQAHNIPSASGYLIRNFTDILTYPVIIKPVDNSGSRGVFYCQDAIAAKRFISEAFEHTKHPYLLAEEFISGQEYSVEALHYGGKTSILQITEKQTTPLPTNVEIGHVAPANISIDIKLAIEALIPKIHQAFAFENCASHTELKIQDGKITVIETSPRLGGDFITSHLVPLTTGINIEDALISICLGETPEVLKSKEAYAGVFFSSFPAGMRLKRLPNLKTLVSNNTIESYAITLKENDVIPAIQSSLDRHCYFLLTSSNRELLEQERGRVDRYINENLETAPPNQ